MLLSSFRVLRVHGRLSTRTFSALGLRSQRPPDSTPDPDEKTTPTAEIPDHEWELRTGRAILVIQETLPHFFNTGLVTSTNKATGSPHRPPSILTATANTHFLEHHILDQDEEYIYSPNVRLSYTPPSPLPAPFPKTLHVEGLQLYLASSTFIRHTMNALYSDLSVSITKLVINTPKGPSHLPKSGQDDHPTPARKKPRINRDKSVLVRQVVSGVGRVSGKMGEWEVESIYTFSPLSGLIHQHIVNSIHPAPHQAVYESIRLSLGKVLGLGWTEQPGSTSMPGGVACKFKLGGKLEGPEASLKGRSS